MYKEEVLQVARPAMPYGQSLQCKHFIFRRSVNRLRAKFLAAEDECKFLIAACCCCRRVFLLRISGTLGAARCSLKVHFDGTSAQPDSVVSLHCGVRCAISALSCSLASGPALYIALAGIRTTCKSRCQLQHTVSAGAASLWAGRAVQS